MREPMGSKKPRAGDAAQGGNSLQISDLSNLFVSEFPPSVQNKIMRLAARLAVPVSVVAMHFALNHGRLS